MPALHAALSGARRTEGDTRRFHLDVTGWLLQKATGPLFSLAGRKFGKVRTPPAFQPASLAGCSTIVSQFDEYQRELLHLTQAARNYDVDRMKIRSPFNSKVSYNIYSALTIVVGHQHRHLTQAEAVWRIGDIPAKH
jgi:hypothetical protein